MSTTNENMNLRRPDGTQRVVITGMGAVSPAGVGVDALWDAVMGKRCCIAPIERFDTSEYEVHNAGEVRDFDATEHGLSKKEARRFERFVQYAMVAADEAMAQAGLNMDEVDSTRVAIAFGTGIGGIDELQKGFETLSDKGPKRVSPLFVPTMIGNIAGIFTLSLLGGGLSGPASPGSIIAEMLMTPKGCYFANIVGIAVAGAVSFAISVFLLKFFGKDASLAEAQAQVAASKAASKGQAAEAATGASVDIHAVKKIVFACDAGMGSSAMGATMLRSKLKDAGITGIEVIHHPVSEIPGDCQIVVTHHELSGRAAQRAPQARIIPIHNFMGAPEYDALVDELLAARKDSAVPAAPAGAPKTEAPAPAGVALLERKNIVLNCAPVTPEEAIRACGRLMVDSGYVDEAYIQGMLDREASFSVAIGSHVAIPHGTNDVKPLIKRTGVVVMTYPQGIDWNGDKVKLVVGIAAKGEEHLEVLGRIVAIASTDEDTDKLVASADAEKLFTSLNGLA